MTLGRAKILSSENDASVSQNTNINIRIAKSTGNLPQQQQPVNFTQTPIQQVETREGPSAALQTGTSFPVPSCQNSLVKQQLQSPTPPIQERGLADLTNELDTLEERNRMLELLLSVLPIYEGETFAGLPVRILSTNFFTITNIIKPFYIMKIGIFLFPLILP